MEGDGKYKKIKVGVAKIKAHVAKTKVDVRETNWELYSFFVGIDLISIIHLDSIFLSLSL